MSHPHALGRGSHEAARTRPFFLFFFLSLFLFLSLFSLSSSFRIGSLHLQSLQVSSPSKADTCSVHRCGCSLGGGPILPTSLFSLSLFFPFSSLHLQKLHFQLCCMSCASLACLGRRLFFSFFLLLFFPPLSQHEPINRQSCFNMKDHTVTHPTTTTNNTRSFSPRADDWLRSRRVERRFSPFGPPILHFCLPFFMIHPIFLHIFILFYLFFLHPSPLSLRFFFASFCRPCPLSGPRFVHVFAATLDMSSPCKHCNLGADVYIACSSWSLKPQQPQKGLQWTGQTAAAPNCDAGAKVCKDCKVCHDIENYIHIGTTHMHPVPGAAAFFTLSFYNPSPAGTLRVGFF